LILFNGFHIYKLSDAFERRQRRNPLYSLRAFAKDLKISPSSLSKILKGSRNIPKKSIDFITSKLDLSDQEKRLFTLSGLGSKKSVKLFTSAFNGDNVDKIDGELYYKVISEWEHFALISLIELDSFQSDKNWISKKLCIKARRLQEVLKNLVEVKMISIEKTGKIKKNVELLDTSNDITSSALKKSHFESLKLAEHKLDDIDIHFRDYSSLTVKTDLAQLPEVKKLIREFQDKLEILLPGTENTEVYQCNIQLFPLTNLET